VALLVDSDAQGYRRTIQHSFEQGERLVQLFRSFREEFETLRYNAGTDPLTGLKNRRTFEEYLGREISRSIRYGTSFALLLLDLRKFKLTNDTYGHAVGDDILRSVARACFEGTRASDISCRIGGDEFAILLPQAERSSVEAFAERVARKFGLYAKPLAPDTPLGIDYGIAIFPEDGDGATKLFQNADEKLYESKQRASRLLEAPSQLEVLRSQSKDWCGITVKDSSGNAGLAAATSIAREIQTVWISKLASQGQRHKFRSI